MTKTSQFAAASFLLAAGACAPAAQETTATPESPHRAEILETVDAFFLALGAPDAEAMATLLIPGSMNVVSNPENDTPLRYSLAQDLLTELTDPAFPKIRERYWDPVVLQRGELAVVWTPYIIDVGDKFSHCGIDIFNLSRHEDGWKIDNTSYTREPSACDALGYSKDMKTRPDYSALDAKEH